MNIWRLYKVRILICLIAAMTAGCALAAWQYSAYHPHAALGHVLWITLIRGPQVAVILFFVVAAVVIPKNGYPKRYGAGDIDGDTNVGNSYMDSVLGLGSGPNLLTDETWKNDDTAP